MANRTAKDAKSVKGTNPQYLVEKIIRMRIYDAKFWKEECFALSAELMVDKGMELRYIGGVYGGNIKPTPFLCLLLKMLQIQPEKDIIVEFIRQEDFKYLRALGAMYMRLTGGSVEMYKYLEPLYNDYRKLRMMNREGRFELTHMDEFIDKLLTQDSVCDITLPRLQKRQVLEETGEIQTYVSALDEDLDDLSASSSDEESKKRDADKPSSSSRHKSTRTSDRRRSDHRDDDRRKETGSSSSRRRSRSRSRERPSSSRRGGSDRDRERSDRRRSDRDRDGRREEKSSRSDRDRRDRGGDRDDKDRKKRGGSWDREVQEANDVRAKLGLAPLQ